jgi:hypothetical protein
MEAADASSSGDQKKSLLNLPTGYHFAPTHEELIIYYLRPKIAGLSPLLPIFQEKNVIEFGPEEITGTRWSTKVLVLVVVDVVICCCC